MRAGSSLVDASHDEEHKDQHQANVLDHQCPRQYSDLQAVARRNGGQGGLEYDHIPSKAALVRALEDRYGRTLDPWERNAVERDATAVAITDVQHRAGCTHGYKNSDAQIQQDGADLPAAMEADLAARRSTLREQGVPGTTIDEILGSDAPTTGNGDHDSAPNPSAG